VLCIIFYSSALKSEEEVKRILISYNQNHKHHKSLASRLIEKLNINPYKIIESDDTNSKHHDTADYDLIIAIGNRANHSFIKPSNKTPFLSLLIPESAYTSLIKQRININKEFLYSAIYIDQPMSRQIRMIKHLSSQFRTISVLLGRNSYSQKNSIIKEIKNNGLTENTVFINNKIELIEKTREAIRNADILLAIPDRNIYNRRTIQSILLTTYRKKIPVIGFSGTFVRAGALAAVYSTPDDISEQAKMTAKKIITKIQLPIREYPSFYNVTINRKVAHSLGLPSFSQTEVIEKLHNDEAPK